MRKEIRHEDELEKLESIVRQASEKSKRVLLEKAGESIDLLWSMKFEEVGHHPLENRRLNLIEQVNQTFTYLATFKALRILLKKHTDAQGFCLNLGTTSGFDIESLTPGLVAAEVFAAVDPKNNKKLDKDMIKVSQSGAKYKYVFFHAPKVNEGRQPHLEKINGVEIWALGSLR
jgi:hypothetical protein